jgi:hypothetical protein
LHLKRTDVDSAVHYAVKPSPALIIEGRRRETWVTRVDSWALGIRSVGLCRATIVLKWAQNRVRVGLVSGTVQITTAIIAAEVVTKRGNGSAIIEDVFAKVARV